jgi:hypothetical protein
MKVQIHDLEIYTDDVNIDIKDNTQDYKASDQTNNLDVFSHKDGSIALFFGDNVTVYLSRSEMQELINLVANAIGAVEVVPPDEEKHP